MLNCSLAKRRRWYAAKVEACLLHEALDALWGFVGEANRFVESEQPWHLAKAARAGEPGAQERLEGVLGDLLESCRVISLASAPFLPGTAALAAEQLGLAYGYGADGSGGPRLADAVRWGAAVESSGAIGTVAPLFPRLEADVPAA